MDDILTTAAAAPVITALVAAIGGALPRIPRRAYPLLAIALGIAWTAADGAATGSLNPRTVLEGIVIGLAASGLYSAALKPMFRGKPARSPLPFREGAGG
jgi:hypothetical protein